MDTNSNNYGDCLDASELGTKNYWDSTYAKEVENFNDHGDIGEVWFGKALLNRIIKWLDENEDIKHCDTIIDLGCGNGWTLIELAKIGYKNLTGIDYSENAIKLALSIAETENFPSIQFQMHDLVDSKQEVGSFRIAFDKGTYDAISLSPDQSTVKRSVYKTNVHNLIDGGGYFIISSCNWTEQELKGYFCDCFEFVTNIPPPKSFQFGGKTGNDYSTVVLRKKPKLQND